MNPTFSQALSLWLKIGCLSFGGPAGQIALMHRELVDERRWVTEQQFLNALNFCMLLPGPEAMQLATYIGWRLHGVSGGLVAGLFFVFPGALIVLALSALYATLGNLPIVESLFQGIQAAVVAIVISALWRISQTALQSWSHRVIALLAFVSLFFLTIPYPLVVIGAGIFGAFFIKEQQLKLEENSVSRPALSADTLKTFLIWGCLWFTPIVALEWLMPSSILTDLAWFFSQLAVVTFGGAYAVLAYMTQDVVVHNAWLTTADMLSGLGLAETTPGPLILVTEFVGFLSAFKQGGWGLGLVGAAITLWVTFVPCFLWIFMGAPYIEWLNTRPRLKGALAAISAAVVGVMLSLSLWFALHILFIGYQSGLPNVTSLQWKSVILMLVSIILLFVLRWNLLVILGVSALASIGLFQLSVL